MKKSNGKRKKYTDEQRSDLVVMLVGAGYPDTLGALKMVSEYSGVPTRTLRRWYTGDNGSPPDKLVSQKKRGLADKFEQIAHTMLDHAGKEDIVEEMRGKDSVTAAAIATDKMRLLRGLPTEIVQIMPDFVEAVEKLGQKPFDVMQRIIERANSDGNDASIKH